MRKVILFFVAITILGVILFQLFPRQKEKFSTVKVERRDLTQTVSASGKIKSHRRVDLKFQTSGLLAWIGIKEGDYVKKGQAIASLDKRELKKKLEKEMQDFLNERWDFEQTQEDYKATKERRLITDAIKKILEKAQFDLNWAVLDYEIANLAIQLATITSPIDGIVIHIDEPIAGVNITPATAVFSVADPQLMYFEASVDEEDIGRVLSGQKAKITLDAYSGMNFDSEVSKIQFMAITTKTGGTAFPVELQLPENKDLRFRLGMNGDVEIITEERLDVLTIPSRAIWRRGEKNYVWKVTNGRAMKQGVKFDFETEEVTAISEGLEEGEKIVIEGVGKIKEEQKIF